MSLDPALDSLLFPFHTGQIVQSGRTLFMRARAGASLRREDWPTLVCEQTFRPAVDALSQAGFPIAAEDSSEFDTVLILPPRQRDEARATFARALRRLATGGRIVACAANNEGARTHQADLERLAGPVTVLSKNKCRVFWTAAATKNESLCDAWLSLDAIRPIVDGRFVSRPGVFAWDRIDAASALLARHLPNDLAGVAADLGAGIGYLATELLSRNRRIASLDLYEAERRALDLSRLNLAKQASDARIDFLWHDVTTGLPRRYDVIVTNPPFHTQSAQDRPDIGKRFIAVAAAALNPNGRLWLVANRHLPYESTLGNSFGSTRNVAQEDGFKVVEAIKRGQ